MRIFPKLLIFLLILFSFTLPAYSQSATIIGENANLRGTPNQMGKVVEVLPNGASVTIIKQSGAWFLVQSPEYVGWVHGNTIRLDSGNHPLEPNADNFTTSGRMKKSASTTSTPRIPASSRRYYLGPRGGCYYLTASGNKEYVDHSLCR